MAPLSDKPFPEGFHQTLLGEVDWSAVPQPNPFRAAAPGLRKYNLTAKQSELRGDTETKVLHTKTDHFRLINPTRGEAKTHTGRGARRDGLFPLVGCFLLFICQLGCQASTLRITRTLTHTHAHYIKLEGRGADSYLSA